MSDALGEVLGPGLTNLLTDTFRRMEIAEGAAKSRYPYLADQIEREAFKILVPPESLRELADEVYRRHAKQLLDRLAARGDTREPTDAEMLGVLSAASFIAPLDRDGAALYGRLFAAVFPERKNMAQGLAAPDDWSVNELEESLRRKMARENSWRRP